MLKNNCDCPSKDYTILIWEQETDWRVLWLTIMSTVLPLFLYLVNEEDMQSTTMTKPWFESIEKVNY